MKPNEFKEIRLRAGFSQMKLATLLDVAQGSISNYEQGYREIPEDVAEKMEKYKK